MTPGRKPYYPDVKTMQAKIDEYFANCVPEFAKDPDGNYLRDAKGGVIVLNWNKPAVTGLALHLGFLSRQSILNYQGKKAFVDTVSRARLRIEHFNEQQLHNPDIRPAGPQFVLYAFGWTSPSVSRDQGGGVDHDAVAKENRVRYQKLFGQYGKVAAQ